jgi:hypothetical protein
MTLAEYLKHMRRRDGRGGEATWRMLGLFLQGFRSRVWGTPPVVHKAADAELRVEAAWCLAEVATALRTMSEEGP